MGVIGEKVISGMNVTASGVNSRCVNRCMGETPGYVIGRVELVNDIYSNEELAIKLA